jgi:hypothetical protein
MSKYWGVLMQYNLKMSENVHSKLMKNGTNI